MEDDVEPMDRMDYGEDARFGSTEVIDDEGMKSALEMFQKVSEAKYDRVSRSHHRLARHLLHNHSLA